MNPAQHILHLYRGLFAVDDVGKAQKALGAQGNVDRAYHTMNLRYALVHTATRVGDAAERIAAHVERGADRIERIADQIERFITMVVELPTRGAVEPFDEPEAKLRTVVISQPDPDDDSSEDESSDDDTQDLER